MPALRSVCVSIGLAALVVATQPAGPSAQQNTSSPSTPGPVMLTNQQDRQRMMDLLKITMFPSGPGAYLAATYDEATANPYPNLPDPLLMNNGTKVTTPAQWAKRRAEIVELFDREVYGRRPKIFPKVKWEVVGTANGTTGSVAVITKQLVGHVDNSAYPAITVNILASLTTPADAKGPVPVVLSFGGGLPQPGQPAQHGAQAEGPHRLRLPVRRRTSRSSRAGGATRVSTPRASRPTAAQGSPSGSLAS